MIRACLVAVPPEYLALVVRQAFASLPFGGLFESVRRYSMTHDAREMSVVRIVIVLIRGIVANHAELAAENLALRQS